MDCQPSCTSSLPWILVIDTLARSNQVDVSILLDLLEKTPEISGDLGRNARELVSLRILKSFSAQGALASLVSSPSSEKIRLDPSDRCEDVLVRILTETSSSHVKPAGPEVSKWDLQPFVEHKISSLSKCPLRQLKDAILSGKYSVFASLKEQGNLATENQGNYDAPVDDSNHNGITPSDTNDDHFLPRDLHDENLVGVNTKRKATSESAGGKSSENDCETQVKKFKKQKYDIICNEQPVDTQIDITVSMQHSEGEGCSLGRKIHLGGMGLTEPEDNNECGSLKWLVGTDEVLPPEKQVPHCDTELNNKSEEQEQDQSIEEPKGDNESFNSIKQTNEGVDRNEGDIPEIVTNVHEVEEDKFEGNIPENVLTVDEAEQDNDVTSDSDGYHDERSNIDTQKKIFLSSQCTHSQDSLATTDWRELKHCEKCKKGGKLLACSSNSCPIVIHESCLDSDQRFDPDAIFYCPFCAYNRAITEYMEVKKTASLARKDLENFICFETQQESNKQSQRSTKEKQNHLEQDNGLLKSNEQKRRDVVGVASNHQRRKKPEHEKAGPSELRSAHSPRFGGKFVDSVNRIDVTLNEVKKDRKETRQRQRSQSARSAEVDEISEETDDHSGASKYFIRVRKPNMKTSYPAIPQLRRKRLPWTSEEEEALKRLMREHYDPHDKHISWKEIWESGVGCFQPSRSAMDLRDKWRNMCKAASKSD